MYVVNTLAPLFFLVALGAVLRRGQFAPASFWRETNRFVYWVALPALMFYKTAEAPVPGGTALRVSLVLLAGTVVCVAVGYGVGRLLGLRPPSVASFVQGAYRGNLFYVGLPVVLFALGGVGEAGAATEALAVVAIAPLVPVYNITAVLVLLAGRGHADGETGRRLRAVLLHIATNPLILSCVGGLGFRFVGATLPLALGRSLSLLSRVALPLALLGIGASLTLEALRRGAAAGLVSAAIKVGVAPLVGVVVGPLLGLDGTTQRMTLLYLACPTAIVSYVMAERLGGDGPLSSSIVVESTLLCPISFAIILAM